MGNDRAATRDQDEDIVAKYGTGVWQPLDIVGRRNFAAFAMGRWESGRRTDVKMKQMSRPQRSATDTQDPGAARRMLKRHGKINSVGDDEMRSGQSPKGVVGVVDARQDDRAMFQVPGERAIIGQSRSAREAFNVHASCRPPSRLP